MRVSGCSDGKVTSAGRRGRGSAASVNRVDNLSGLQQREALSAGHRRFPRRLHLIVLLFCNHVKILALQNKTFPIIHLLFLKLRSKKVLNKSC